MDGREDAPEGAYIGAPTGVAAIRGIALAAFQAGYDASTEEGRETLSEDLRWIRETRIRQRAKASRRTAWSATLWTAIVTGIITAVLSWLTAFFSRGFGPPPHGGG